MEATNVIFKKLEVVGTTKDEALAKAPFYIQGDATTAFKKWKETQNEVTESAVKEFCKNYLAKKKAAPGVGFSITVQTPVVDSRERPYKVTDIKNEEGKRKMKRYHVLKNKETGEILAKFDGTKAEAKNMAKELILNGFHGTLVSELQAFVEGNNAIEFEAAYTPSKGTKAGTYIVFGNIDAERI
jgi:hypothetical protein